MIASYVYHASWPDMVMGLFKIRYFKCLIYFTVTWADLHKKGDLHQHKSRLISYKVFSFLLDIANCVA